MARAIVRYADGIEADLIVLASHNPMVWDVFLGSKAAQMVKHARHSVLVVRQSVEEKKAASSGPKASADAADSVSG